jgi:hypothetical protein
MDNLFKKNNVGELILTIIFIIYLIMGYKMPESIANFIDTLAGKIVIFIIVIYMFLYKNPLLAVLSLFVAFDILRRSSQATGIDALQKFAPSEEKKTSQFNAFNQFPYTLEQEIVKKMTPMVNCGSCVSKPTYKPLLDNTYDATPIA